MINNVAPRITVGATGVSITTGAASAGATLPNDSSGNKAKYYRVACATAAALVRVGNGAQTAIATDLLVQPGDAVILNCAGCTNVAAIQLASAGTVIVTPLEDR